MGKVEEDSLQIHHVDSTLKQRGNGRFHVVSTWNPRGVFVGFFQEKLIEHFFHHGDNGSFKDMIVQIIDFCDPSDQEKREDLWMDPTLSRGIKYEKS